MTLRFYNSATRRKEVFEPRHPGRVSMYVCGPTVYDLAHIGNGRTFVSFDLVYRLLAHEYGRDNVVFVRNITDVEDKINQAAADRGISIRELTTETEAAFLEDMGVLGVSPPTYAPRVTDSIPAIIAMIEALIAHGHAYEAEAHVLFQVDSFAEYGALSGRSVEDMIAGARIDVAPFKRSPADFVLWKPSPPELPGWDSPWGRGRPGWHIECSAMIEAVLGPAFGDTIDIHAGGNDLIFPHHENELAQSACAHGGAALAKFWLHSGMLTVEGAKMSKSLGNFLTVQDVLSWGIPGEAIRYYMLKTHYHSPMDWTKAGLGLAWKELDRFYNLLRQVGPAAFEHAEPPEAFLAALADDLNTPGALAVLHDVAGQANSAEGAEKDRLAAQIRAAGAVLGILQSNVAAWFTGSITDGDAIEERINARNQARKDRDFATADRIRDELLAEGIVLEDGPTGTIWRRAS